MKENHQSITKATYVVLGIYMDGMKGFQEAISAIYPQSQVQRCIIHQIRSSTRFVSDKDIKELMADLKLVSTAVTENAGRTYLELFGEKWRKQYPSCVRSWEENWTVFSTCFAYPLEIRKIIYTTNIIEGLNWQVRQITKNKPPFTNDDSLRKMLYLSSKKIVEHRTGKCQKREKFGSGFKLTASVICRSESYVISPVKIEFPDEADIIHTLCA